MRCWVLSILLLFSANLLSGQERELYSGEWRINDPFNVTGHAAYAFYNDYSTGKKILDRAFSIIYYDEQIDITVTGSFADNARDGKWQLDFEFKNFPYGDNSLLNGFVHLTQRFSKGTPHGEWVSASKLISGTGDSPSPSTVDEENLSLTFNHGIVTGKVIYMSNRNGESQMFSFNTDSLSFMHGHWSNEYRNTTVVSTYNHGLPVRIVHIDHASGDSIVKIEASADQFHDWQTAYPLFISNRYLCSLMYEVFDIRYDEFDNTISEIFNRNIVSALHIPGEVNWIKEKSFKVAYLYQVRSSAEDQCKVGNYYLEHGDTALAEAWFMKAAIEHPDNGLGFFKLGKLAESQQNTIMTLRRLSMASLNNYPEADDAIIDYGIKLMKKGDNEASKETFKLLTVLKPQNATAWDNLGWAYMEIDSIPKALSAFEKSESLSPSPDSFTGKVVCLFLTGEKKQARIYYESARTLYPFIYPADNLITSLIIKGYYYTDKQQRMIRESIKKL